MNNFLALLLSFFGILLAYGVFRLFRFYLREKKKETQKLQAFQKEIQDLKEQLTQYSGGNSLELGQIEQRLGTIYQEGAWHYHAEQKNSYLKQALEHYQNALDALDVEEYPKQYAEVLASLGDVYGLFPLKEGSYFSQAENTLLEALEIYTAQELPLQKARVSRDLAFLYWKYSREKNLEYNLERSLKACLPVIDYLENLSPDDPNYEEMKEHQLYFHTVNLFGEITIAESAHTRERGHLHRAKRINQTLLQQLQKSGNEPFMTFQTKSLIQQIDKTLKSLLTA